MRANHWLRATIMHRANLLNATYNFIYFNSIYSINSILNLTLILLYKNIKINYLQVVNKFKKYKKYLNLFNLAPGGNKIHNFMYLH